MRFAAFFRNVNLGRPGKPTREQFVQAFEAAGGAGVRSFLTHGNAVFSASGKRAAQAVLRDACQRLEDVCGLAEPAFLRSLDSLAKLVASDPFADGPDDDIYERCVTFVPPKAVPLLELPAINARRDVEIFAAGEAEFLSVSRKFTASPGSPNAWLERTLGMDATTRAWNTVVRISRLED
ncbi:DUF1697 domain-containing protein [Albitalea terrae]|uniref:DUF1697 domain-containing protein n=2 Tax=Piscinibacter terrae TaxID=2496871 RepID=A0A3N7HUF8_9BURK|nr:DUF1697 domain-containing protein [Albitalea terrae]